MSGKSIAPIFEKHGDVYITGGTVVRHKVLTDGCESDVFPTEYDTQLVLSTHHMYKLWQRLSPSPLGEKTQMRRGKDNDDIDGGTQHRQQQQEEEEEETNSAPPPPPPPPPPELIWRESLGLIRAVVPLYNHPSRAGTAGPNGLVVNCHGFAIEFFSPHKNGFKPPEKRTVLQRYMKEQCCCVGDVFRDVVLTTTDGGRGGLRVREYHVGRSRPQHQPQQQESQPLSPCTPCASNEGSAFLEQDWCYALRQTLVNYWHERLEDSLIEEPEIFQYQVYAMEFPNSDLGSLGKQRQADQEPLLCQLVLSTERLYVVPRHDAKLLSLELPLQHPEMKSRWFTVNALQSISFDSNTGVFVCTGRQEPPDACLHSAPSAVSSAAEFLKTVTLTLGFFSVAEAEAALLEIQRVWEMTHRRDDFPLA